jgi:hypothetical protein
VTTNQYVGGVGCDSSDNEVSGGFNGGVVINPGDTLRVDLDGAYNPTSVASGFTVQAWTSSDTAAVTSSNSFSTVAQQLVTGVSVSQTGVSAAVGARSAYSVSFTTSSTGGLSQADGSSWTLDFPSNMDVCNLSGGSVTDVTTNQYVGGVGCDSSDNEVSGGFNGGVVINPGDTLRVDLDGVLNPPDVGAQSVSATTSSDTVAAQGSFTTTPTSDASGTVVDENGNPVSGSNVQACPSSGGVCQNGRSLSDGTFTVIGLQTGAYTVVAFPPAGAAGAQSSSAEINVQFPNAVTGLRLQLPGTTVMPPGVTLDSGGTTQQGTVPVINWGNPTTLHVTGCKGGYGIVTIRGMNTQTGLSVAQDFPLVETPTGSGDYVANIPALAPVHGATTVTQSVACPGHTSILPDGGDSSGATSVFVAGSGFAGTTSVYFGSKPAISFKVVSDHALTAVSPPGTGNVALVVKSSSSTQTVGNYDYFGVTHLDRTTGPAAGGTEVTIIGSGFTNVRGVIFGVVPATSFHVINPTEIDAVAPSGFGTVDVQVLNGFALSLAVAADLYTYTGGPSGLVISEGTGPSALQTYAGQLAQSPVLNQDCQQEANSGIQGLGAICTVPQRILDATNVQSAIEGTLVTGLLGAAATLACLAGGCEAAIAAAAIGTLAFLGYTIWTLLVDPSGTIVNTDGSPVKGATVTLLEQLAPPNGPYTVVPEASGDIDPAVNPEVTNATGEFDWNALSGTYEIRASAPGCTEPGKSSQHYVTSSSFQLPPPVVGLVLTMSCRGEKRPAPRIEGLSSSTGLESGGSVLQIVGTGFEGTRSVHFGATPASGVAVLSPSAVDVVVPPGHSSVNVRVTTAGGTSAVSKSDQFSYTKLSQSKSSPSISSVSPTSGPLFGGTRVTIRGRNLSDATQVLFGGIPASAELIVSPTEVKATAPQCAISASVGVSVVGPSGESLVTKRTTYAFVPPPRITRITPDKGPARGGTKVVIEGLNLLGTFKVSFGGSRASRVRLNRARTELTVTAPPHAPGNVYVTVTTPGGTSVIVAADRFTYT